jgi:hypothetical protein
LAFSPLQMGIGMPTHNNSIFISLQGFLGPAQLLPVWSTQTTNIARAKHMRFSQNEGCQLHKARLVYKQLPNSLYISPVKLVSPCIKKGPLEFSNIFFTLGKSRVV